MSSHQIAAEQMLPESGDRRLAPRVRVSDLVYVDLGPGNGGMVLDISEGGLTFQAVQPLERGQLVRLNVLLPGLAQTLNTEAQIVWLNDTSNGGGLRFVDLPEANRNEIQRWVAQQVAPRSLQQKLASQLPPDDVELRPSTAPDLPVPATPPPLNPDASAPLPASNARPSSSPGAPARTPVPIASRNSADKRPIPRRKPVVKQPPRPLARNLWNSLRPSWDRIVISNPLPNFRPHLARISAIAGIVVILVLGATLGRPLLRRGYLEIARLWHGASRAPLTTTTAASPALPKAGAASLFVPAFQVEILQPTKRWVLTFSPDDSQPAAEISPKPKPTPPPQNLMDAPDLRAAAQRDLRDFVIRTPRVPAHPSSPGASTGGGPAAPAVSLAPNTSGAPGASVLVNPEAPLFRPEALKVPGATKSNFQNAVQIAAGQVIYPALARSLHVEGDVRVHVTIGKDGIPRELKVISGPATLREAALQAVQQGRYKAAMLDGSPVEQDMDITVAFRLNP